MFTACGIMHRRCCRPAASSVHYTTSSNTQSSAPEDGQNNCPKHVELIEIINKLLLLRLVGCLYYFVQVDSETHSPSLWKITEIYFPVDKGGRIVKLTIHLQHPVSPTYLIIL